MNNLVGDVKANPRDFYRYINSQKKDTQGIPPLKKRNGSGIAQSEFEKAEEFNGQFSVVFTKSEYNRELTIKCKVNTNRSLLWIDLPHSCMILWSQRKG